MGEDTVGIRYGPAYDEANSVWDDRYSQGPGNHNLSNGRSEGTGPSNSRYFSYDDAIHYWLHYADGHGFFIYCERNEGDGNDKVWNLGFSNVSKLWDYSTASARESDYSVFLHAYTDRDDASYWGFPDGTCE